MNIAHNFLAVSDAPLRAAPVHAVISLLTDAVTTMLVTSKQTKAGKYSTTVYDPLAHQLCRAQHDHGIRATLKSIARNNVCVQLLSSHEVVDVEPTEYDYVVRRG